MRHICPTPELSPSGCPEEISALELRSTEWS
jgi:hypothetical protein